MDDLVQALGNLLGGLCGLRAGTTLHFVRWCGRGRNALRCLGRIVVVVVGHVLSLVGNLDRRRGWPLLVRLWLLLLLLLRATIVIVIPLVQGLLVFLSFRDARGVRSIVGALEVPHAIDAREGRVAAALRVLIQLGLLDRLLAGVADERAVRRIE